MTKADKVLILCIMLMSAGLILPIINHAPVASTASVMVKNQEVLKINLSKDAAYTVKGTLGNVYIQVRNGKVRVRQENSPHHLCSRQGYVSDPNTPIVCLPNETVVQIDSDKAKQDTVIQ